MPTNLPPEYYQVEERYKAAQTDEEKIELIEEMLSTIPKHKGTDHLRADYRRRLSKLKETAQSQKKTGGHTSAFSIGKEGAGQIAVVGHANTGKSTLVAQNTNATPEVSASPFSTWQPTPGMMMIDNIQVQLIDTPPLNRDYLEPEMLQMIRHADMILLMVDVEADLLTQLEEAAKLLIENRIIPLHLKEQYPERGNKYIPAFVLVNKCDQVEDDEDYKVFCELLDIKWPCMPIATATGRNLDKLKARIIADLQVIRVYSKAPGQEIDASAPFTLTQGSTLADFARKVHKDFYVNLKTARLWGSSADFDGQMVSREHILQDGDIVELRI